VICRLEVNGKITALKNNVKLKQVRSVYKYGETKICSNKNTWHSDSSLFNSAIDNCIASAQNLNTSSVGPMVGPFGYYPPAPYGDSGDREVVCGPYGCYWNEATAYLSELVLAEEAW